MMKKSDEQSLLIVHKSRSSIIEKKIQIILVILLTGIFGLLIVQLFKNGKIVFGNKLYSIQQC